MFIYIKTKRRQEYKGCSAKIEKIGNPQKLHPTKICAGMLLCNPHTENLGALGMIKLRIGENYAVEKN